ncbi:hypothetical protein HRR83_007318 [Exophiala dermatitidis]|uniref:Kinetochore protein Mis14 n=2 Tax=Exophiala dermatitidis TaxID=5970 RepID=H6C1K3_EXODN|nr:uncharacterized protein HMPREF1120_06601 [Exophiala dermatitidis NIH/UT8656]KAJ4508387.1 hypothetical protein HRR75_006208 [Exophiala dermatitidis]EHY58593.1 hypothetical protein HMPREF1120_06601 [Exophiala dermatitidis NIH/UT8656]KAJ4510293.1 hypothetical protein HRR74_006765 [Exophiala dermatitidis]KAJ4510773.1 hypothetical protein HRR73_006845 [Exophiala dermatitidis]KAJ4534894.1 hypothetical protein HRR76_006801 [Exophiala dermatitidis]
MSLEEAHAHPPRAPDTHHRKIELQSPYDLTYLQANLAASAKEKLDLHFPPSAAQKGANTRAQPATVISLDGVNPTTTTTTTTTSSHAPGAAGSETEQQTKGSKEENEEEDPLRARVRALVDSFMTRTWEGARQNIVVNGMDATLFPMLTTTAGARQQPGGKEQEEKEGIDFVYEPYDTRLQAKVAGLYGELEALTAQVSKLRRVAPKQGATAYADALMARIAEDEAEFEARVAAIRGEKQSVPAEWELKPPPSTAREGWSDDVKEMYERATGQLASLAGLVTAANEAESTVAQGGQPSLTETVGKVQRATTVAMEFE